MLIELIATVCAGAAGGGVALILRRLVRALPKWLVPVAAGVAMIVTAVALEYSWYGRTADALPDTVEVALARENRAPWRPWTYMLPYRDGFIAVDHGSVRTNDTVPGQRIVDLYVFGRWTPTHRLRAVFDCIEGRRADFAADTGIDASGQIEGVTWRTTGLDDPVTRAVCAGDGE